MTRGSIPRFDLYEELEVSRQASGEVIEAAYRALVKRHHPDVATSEDRERIKRLNVAREWLVSPAKRARYDAAAIGAGRSGGAVDRESATPASAGTRRRPRAGGPATAAGSSTGTTDPGPSSRTSSPSSFGVNSREVRHFLADLRELDESRATRLIAARDGLDATPYAEARRAALAAGRLRREAEWLFARDAAAVIAKGKLAFSPLSPVVAAVVADIAGAIVVRDLIQPVDLDLLLEPWRQSAAPAKATALADRDRGSVRLAPRPIAWPTVARIATRTIRGRGDRLPLGVGIVAAGVLLFVAASALGLGPRRPEAEVAGLTSPPSPGAVAGVATPRPAPSWSAGSYAPPSTASETPIAVPTGSGALPSAVPAGPPMPRPTPLAGPSGTPLAPTLPSPTLPASPGPGPSDAPTSPPPPTPTPPPPTATPTVDCTVVDLVGVNSSNAQLAWSSAGFTGTVLFTPPIPPQYKIAWQSLVPGSVVPCASDITVAATAP